MAKDIALDFDIKKSYLLRKRITPNWNVKFFSLLLKEFNHIGM
nr:MAG TPA: hypothetical protein [Caudoviricetes sp.]